jgi:hypothetical protein
LNEWIIFALLFLIEIISIVFTIIILRNKYLKKLKEISNDNRTNQINKLQFETSELKPFMISSQYITHQDKRSDKANKINQEEMERIERNLVSDLSHSFANNLVSNNLIQKNVYQTSDGWDVKYSCMYWMKVNKFECNKKVDDNGQYV